MRGKPLYFLGRFGAYIAVAVSLAVYLIPLIVLILMSIGANVPGKQFIPKEINMRGYINIFTNPAFNIWIINSLIFTLGVTAGIIVISSIAGYALSRIDFLGKGVLFWVITGAMMIPGIALYLPLYVLLAKMKLLGTYIALLIPPMASPYSVFMMKQAFDAIPRDYEEAAIMDGARTIDVIFRVFLPIAKPVFITLTLFNIVWNWNNFAWPLFISTSPLLWNLPLGIWNLTWSYTVDFWNLAAGAVVLFVPPLVLYIVAIEYFLRGIVVTGLKK